MHGWLCITFQIENLGCYTNSEEKGYSISQSWRYARGKKFMKENGIKAEDVKSLPPDEEIHGLNSSQIVQ